MLACKRGLQAWPTASQHAKSRPDAKLPNTRTVELYCCGGVCGFWLSVAVVDLMLLAHVVSALMPSDIPGVGGHYFLLILFAVVTCCGCLDACLSMNNPLSLTD